MHKKWTKETVFEESKKYSSRSEFKKKKSGAFRIAYMNGWLDEMIWLVRPTAKPIKWTKEAVFEESRKYFIVTEFMNNAVTAYTIAKNNNWLTIKKVVVWICRKILNIGLPNRNGTSIGLIKNIFIANRIAVSLIQL